MRPRDDTAEKETPRARIIGRRRGGRLPRFPRPISITFLVQEILDPQNLLPGHALPAIEPVVYGLSASSDRPSQLGLAPPFLLAPVPKLH
jgi:hypothetical protein